MRLSFYGVALAAALAGVTSARMAAQQAQGAPPPAAVPQPARVAAPIDMTGTWASVINEDWQWRFVTPIFLHVHLPGLGPLHLLSNMYGLFMLGPYVEKLYGWARFVVFWILTGIAGVAASYLAVRPEWARGALGQFLFRPYDAPSAGASLPRIPPGLPSELLDRRPDIRQAEQQLVVNSRRVVHPD
jgi:hypothetical protein